MRLLSDRKRLTSMRWRQKQARERINERFAQYFPNIKWITRKPTVEIDLRVMNQDGKRCKN